MANSFKNWRVLFKRITFKRHQKDLASEIGSKKTLRGPF